nr:MAG TPA: hypothetical protein [Caudoviricetes sp.]
MIWMFYYNKHTNHSIRNLRISVQFEHLEKFLKSELSSLVEQDSSASKYF